MGTTQRLRDVDQRVEDGLARWAGRSRLARWFGWRPAEPRGATARALWATLDERDRDTLRRMAMFGREAHDPRNALIVAELADEHLRWQWKGMGWGGLALVVILGTFVLATGEFHASILGGPIGAAIGTTLGVYRVDRGRRANLTKAQDAGLI